MPAFLPLARVHLPLALALGAVLWGSLPALAILAAACLVLAGLTRRRFPVFVALFCLAFLAYAASLALYDARVDIADRALRDCLSRLAVAVMPLAMLAVSRPLGWRYACLRPGHPALPIGDPAGPARPGRRAPPPVWLVTLGVCLGTALSFLPFIRWQQPLLAASLLFATINAPLEELFWRGIVLSGLRRFTGQRTALVWSSLLFGAAHALLGMPLWTCLVFALGGLGFGLLALRSRGIALPAAVHWTANIGFGLSGIILN